MAIRLLLHPLLSLDDGATKVVVEYDDSRRRWNACVEVGENATVPTAMSKAKIDFLVVIFLP